MELLPKEEIEAKKLKNISLNAVRLSILVSLVLLVGSTVMLPFTVRKIGAQWSQDQSGITARIEKPKIEVSGLDTAMQGIYSPTLGVVPLLVFRVSNTSNNLDIYC